MKKAQIDEILDAGDPPLVEKRERKVRRDFWKTMRKAFRYLPFAEDIVAAFYCAIDHKTPLKVRGTLLAALAYFVLPLDFVPDFILGIGFGDDIAVLTAAITGLRAHMTKEHYRLARKALNEKF